MEIVGGTYDRLLFGLRYDAEDGIRQTFAYAPHGGCIKALAMRGKLLVSGSTDESIKIYDILKKREIGTLMQHNAPVTCLEFASRHHLLSGSEDKSICVWSTSGWESLHSLKGHKGPVNSLAVHSSGKLALSASKDKTVKLWDLIKGKSAYSQDVQAEVEQLKWSPSGDRYAILQGTDVTIRSAKDNSVVSVFKHNKRINCFSFVDDDFVVCGGEEKVVCKWSLKTGTMELSSPEPHQNRIRGLAVVHDSSLPGAN
eukprot:tig00000912_g5434.t1